jgi:hypothetical protein
LSRGNVSGFAYDFEQRNHRNVVTGIKQQYHYNVYVYTFSGSVCYNGYDDHYGKSKCDTYVYPSSSDLSRRNVSGFANDFEQRNHRNVVAGIKQQYHNNLYVYTNGRSMCDNGYDDHYGKSKCDSYVYASSSDLSRGYVSGFTNNFE